MRDSLNKANEILTFSWVEFCEQPSPQIGLRWVPVTFCTMEFFPVATSVSSLASKIVGSTVMAVSLTKATELVSAGLTLLSTAALSQATASLGSLLGTLKASGLLGSPVVNLTLSKAGAKAAAAVIGGALSVAAVPLVLEVAGFTGAGITASSLAAKMMSAAAIANGGGVAAGSLVAMLQSVGAAGLSPSSKIILGSAGTALVSRMVGL
ncbi:PREDICTED: interferon alpha-inducible protein 27-like protein 1 [Odobenus rosmarus divergens]|uniref:Interferon alpha-inducible protein 27-like protein 1 n=1 Tax=Odobenus rosmarus divergens TaxID=9708 RepID=A0A2U3VIN7_ODORO|nr:PREDICTED: interferon alpha-inducible protein 27-like protein 1 [Odobenus rosmarus divergens]